MSNPLNKDQRNLLKEVIGNDVTLVERNIRQLAAEALEAKKATIKEQFAAATTKANDANVAIKNLQDYQRQERDELGRAQMAAMDLLVKEFDDVEGIVFNGDRYVVNGQNTAEAEAAKEIQSTVNKAVAVLYNKQDELIRNVLVAGIKGGEADAILDALPSAEDMMAQAVELEEAPDVPAIYSISEPRY